MRDTTTIAGARPWLAGAVLGAAMLAGLGLSLLSAGHEAARDGLAAVTVSTKTTTSSSTSLTTAPEDKSGTRWG